MTILQDLVAARKRIKEAEWPTARDLINAGSFSSEAPSIMAELHRACQPKGVFEKKRRPDGAYGYRLRPGADLEEIEQQERRKPGPPPIAMVSGVLDEVREALRTHSTVKAVATVTKRSEYVVTECCKALVKRGEAEDKGNGCYSLKLPTGRAGIERVSQAHTDAMSTQPQKPRLVALTDKPKSEVPKPQQDASPRKDEGRSAEVDSRVGESATSVKDTALPAPAAAPGVVGSRTAAQFPKAIAASLAERRDDTPIEDRFHIEKTLQWLKARRDSVEAERIQLNMAIGALEQVLAVNL